MPNGHREPYRLRGGLATGGGVRDFWFAAGLPPFEIPSPVHSSDSEETWYNKREWAFVARRVLFRWRAFVRRARQRRRILRWLRNVFFQSNEELRPLLFVAPRVVLFLT